MFWSALIGLCFLIGASYTGPSKTLDTVILVDSSGSAKDRDKYDLIRKFVITLTVELVKTQKHRVGIISFSGVVYRVILKLTNNKKQVISGIKALNNTGGFSYVTDDALADVVKKVFDASVKVGDGKQVVTVLGGNPNSYDAISKAAKNFKSRGVEMYSVGIGPDFFKDTKELRALASLPLKDHTLRTTYGSLLKSSPIMMKKLKKVAAAPPAPKLLAPQKTKAPVKKLAEAPVKKLAEAPVKKLAEAPVKKLKKLRKKKGRKHRGTPLPLTTKHQQSVTKPHEVTKQHTTAIKHQATAMKQHTTAIKNQATAMKFQSTAMKQQATVMKQQATAIKQHTTARKHQATAMKLPSTAAKDQHTSADQNSMSDDVVRISQAPRDTGTVNIIDATETGSGFEYEPPHKNLLQHYFGEGFSTNRQPNTASPDMQKLITSNASNTGGQPSCVGSIPLANKILTNGTMVTGIVPTYTNSSVPSTARHDCDPSTALEEGISTGDSGIDATWDYGK